MLVSIIIPAYNLGSEFQDCLSAISLSEYRHLEVVIVDDCSSPKIETPSMPFQVKAIRSELPAGPGVARNIGAQYATGEILLFIDSDVSIQADTVSKIVERFKNDPELAAISGLYTYRNRYRNPSSFYHTLYIEYKQKHIPAEGPYADTAVLGVRRKIFVAAGGFTPGVYTGEDLEFGSRLYKNGHKVCCDKSIRVTHNKFFTFKGWLINRFCHGTNMVMLKLKRLSEKNYEKVDERPLFTILPAQIASAFLSWGGIMFIVSFFIFGMPILISLALLSLALYIMVNARYVSFIYQRAKYRSFILLPLLLMEHLVAFCAALAGSVLVILKWPHIAYRGDIK